MLLSDPTKVDVYRADSRFAPSQWETSLQSNAPSHWLDVNLESARVYIMALMNTSLGKTTAGDKIERNFQKRCLVTTIGVYEGHVTRAYEILRHRNGSVWGMVLIEKLNIYISSIKFNTQRDHISTYHLTSIGIRVTKMRQLSRPSYLYINLQRGLYWQDHLDFTDKE